MKYDIYNELMSMSGVSAEHRAFLDYVKPKCYVEAEGRRQSGTVVSVIRDRRHVPVCLKVRCGDGVYDYIQTDNVTHFEPFDDYACDISEYSDGFPWDSADDIPDDDGEVEE